MDFLAFLRAPKEQIAADFNLPEPVICGQADLLHGDPVQAARHSEQGFALYRAFERRPLITRQSIVRFDAAGQSGRTAV